MRLLLLITPIVLGVCLTGTDGQFFAGLSNIFRQTFNGATRAFGPRFRDDGTQTPVSTGKDQILPSDCGTHTDTGRGKLCFPDGKLCAESK